MRNNHNKKIRVAVLFGGKSAEHELSLMSAKNIYHALDKEKFVDIITEAVKKKARG